jgi:digeranylgeranylglycerophospholipid reductase
MDERDVVVVGAGPAGTTTAYHLARSGLDVLLVEKRPEIGMPVRCGEATGLSTFREFDLEPTSRIVAAETRGTLLYSPNGTEVDLTAPEPNGYVLERRLFDKELAIRAAKAGAEVRVRTYVTGLLREGRVVKGVVLRHFEEEEAVPCRCVVGADGIEGKIGRWAGINTRTRLSQMASNAQYEIAGADLEHPDLLEFHFGERVAPKGYVWIFPKGKDVANVGLGVRGSSETALAYLERFLEGHPRLREGSPVAVMVGGVPVQGPLERSVADGLLLVGDSARQVDPLTGGGIYTAMKCGALAAQTIREAIEAGDLSASRLMAYDVAWRETVGKGLLRSLRVKEVIEKMTDEEMDAVAQAMRGLQLGNVDIKDVSSVMFSLPPELLNFIQSLLGGG